ncbi:MAG: hypothetical protein QME12_00840 [Nanoarchaeota archaeon]|nr:hypothetical protein [Nanoarchaeota archaeon]
MKKRICLFAIMLSALALPAFALDINIAGRPYPAFIFIPLALIAFVWLIIFFRWLFRHFRGIALFFYNAGKFIFSLGLKLGFKKLKEEIREKEIIVGKVPKEEKKEVPEEATRDLTPFIEKINAIEKKLVKTKDADAVFKELSPVIKNFFKALLSIHYEFTDEEMVGVLEKKKKHLVDFAQRISEMKFSGKKVTEAQAEALVKEFKGIVHRYVETGWKPKRIARGVVERLAEQDKKIFDNVKQYVGFLGGESRKRQIEGLLEDEQEILTRNISSMKRTYNRILRMYVQLTPNEKAAVYPQLIAFYKNANKAIFSSVYGEKSKKELEYFVKELQKLKEMPKHEPWLARLAASVSAAKETIKKKARRKPKKELVAPQPSVKAKVKAKEAPKEELPSIKPLFEKLTGMFRPEEVSEKKAKKMIQAKAAPKVKLEEPTLKPIAEKLGALKDSAKKFFSRIPTKAVKVEKEELVVPKPSVETFSAIEKIGKMLEETPAIEQVDYMKKVEAKIAQGWNLIAAADFDSFDSLYEQIKLDYVNLSGREKEVMQQRMSNLFDAAEKAKEQIELKAGEDEKRKQERKAEEMLQAGIRTREREEAQKEAMKMAAEIQKELTEEEELEKEEGILLKLEEERKRKEREAGIAREQKEIRGVLRKVQEKFKEQDEIDTEEDELLGWWEKRKRRKARREELKASREQEELAKEEEELLSWAEKRKRMKERREALKIAGQIEKQRAEKEELEKEEEILLKLEAERKEREAKAFTLKEKREARAALRQIDSLFRQRQKLEEENLARERRLEAEKRRLETIEKRKMQQQIVPEIAKIDSILKEQAKPLLEEFRKRREEGIAERKLRREIQKQIRHERAIKEKEAEFLKREGERRRAELDKRKKETGKIRAEKEKEWKQSMHGKSLDSLEELQNQLSSMIVGMERQAAPKESFKIKLAKEAEIVRQEVEAKRAAQLKKITEKPAEKKKKKALSPLEEEQLKLILELERINKGL